MHKIQELVLLLVELVKDSKWEESLAVAKELREVLDTYRKAC